MVKPNKKKIKEVMKEKFPELYKLSEELSESLDCILIDIQDKLDKIYEVQDQLEELKNAKIELDNDVN